MELVARLEEKEHASLSRSKARIVELETALQEQEQRQAALVAEWEAKVAAAEAAAAETADAAVVRARDEAAAAVASSDATKESAAQLVQQLWTGLCLAVGADAAAIELPSGLALDDEWVEALHVCDTHSRHREARLAALERERGHLHEVATHLQALVQHGTDKRVPTPVRPRRRQRRFGALEMLADTASGAGDGAAEGTAGSAPADEDVDEPRADAQMRRLLADLRKAQSELQEQAGVSAGLEAALLGTVEALPRLHEARELAEMRTAELEQVRPSTCPLPMAGPSLTCVACPAAAYGIGGC